MNEMNRRRTRPRSIGLAASWLALPARLSHTALTLAGSTCLALCSCTALQEVSIADARPATSVSDPGLARVLGPAPPTASTADAVELIDHKVHSAPLPGGIDCPIEYPLVPYTYDFTPAESRLPIIEFPEPHPDEYICDGGDRGYPIHFHSAAIQGLETEDTFALYRDDTGELNLRATNKVCIYAPRFGAVRTFSGPYADVGVGHLAKAQQNRRGLGLHTPQGVTAHARNTPPVGIRMRSRLSGMENNEAPQDLLQLAASNSHTRWQSALQQTRFLQRG
jgi:hypothetical protein